MENYLRVPKQDVKLVLEVDKLICTDDSIYRVIDVGDDVYLCEIIR